MVGLSNSFTGSASEFVLRRGLSAAAALSPILSASELRPRLPPLPRRRYGTSSVRLPPTPLPHQGAKRASTPAPTRPSATSGRSHGFRGRRGSGEGVGGAASATSRWAPPPPTSTASPTPSSASRPRAPTPCSSSSPPPRSTPRPTSTSPSSAMRPPRPRIESRRDAGACTRLAATHAESPTTSEPTAATSHKAGARARGQGRPGRHVSSTIFSSQLPGAWARVRACVPGRGDDRWGCYSAYASSRKLRGRFFLVLPVSKRDRDLSSSAAAAAGPGSGTSSPTKNNNSVADEEAAGPLVSKTTAAEFARRYVLQGARARRVRRDAPVQGRRHEGGARVQDDTAAPAPRRRPRGAEDWRRGTHGWAAAQQEAAAAAAAAHAADVRREVAIMWRMSARGGAVVVRLREAREDADGAVHLVMELCEGGKLFDRIIARGHYPERAAASIFGTIVDVVQLCHSNGVIDRDLKRCGGCVSLPRIRWRRGQRR